MSALRTPHGFFTMLALIASGTVPQSVSGQQRDARPALSAPAFFVLPDLDRSHVFSQPRVSHITSGAMSELKVCDNLLQQFVVALPTHLPG